MSCPDCRAGSVLPGEPTGTINSDFEGAYSALAPNGQPKRAIILLTDGFGLALQNCKIMADRMAKELDSDVWIPDYFKGRPLVPVDNLLLPDRAGVKLSIWDWIKFIASAIPGLPAFFASRPSVVDNRLDKWLKLLQEKKKYEKIGAVGYCYGGSTVVRLGATDRVQSIVICHPGGFSIQEAKAIKVPAAWACAEDDLFFSQSLRLKTEALFAARKDTPQFVEYEFKDYKGTAHGFAARPNVNLPEIMEAYEQAFQQTVNWFSKTLPISSPGEV